MRKAVNSRRVIACHTPFFWAICLFFWKWRVGMQKSGKKMLKSTYKWLIRGLFFFPLAWSGMHDRVHRVGLWMVWLLLADISAYSSNIYRCICFVKPYPGLFEKPEFLWLSLLSNHLKEEEAKEQSSQFCPSHSPVSYLLSDWNPWLFVIPMAGHMPSWLVWTVKSGWELCCRLNRVNVSGIKRRSWLFNLGAKQYCKNEKEIKANMSLTKDKQTWWKLILLNVNIKRNFNFDCWFCCPLTGIPPHSSPVLVNTVVQEPIPPAVLQEEHSA